MASKEADERRKDQGGSQKKSLMKHGKGEERAKVHIKVKGVRGRSEKETGALTARSVSGEGEESQRKIEGQAEGSWGDGNPVSNQPKVKHENPGGVQQISKALLEPSLHDKCHSDCYKRPAFVALKKVPLEEQRLVTVEFTPMERPKTAQSHVRPKSVMNKHAWAEKVVRSKVEGERRHSRTQSAQYYKTKYHKQAEDYEYRER